MTLEVTRKSIPDLLQFALQGEWQIPNFQREFVWKVPQVHALIESVFRGRPIGMITLWEQPKGNAQTDATKVKLKDAVYGDPHVEPGQIALVLDGRQRLTSLAIAFGGLREVDGRSPYSLSWFIDLDRDPKSDEFVVFKTKKEVQREQLDTRAICIARGLLPLDRCSEFQEMLGGMFDPAMYPNNQLPDASRLRERRDRLSAYSSMFLRFQVPVAALPVSVSLAEVCEIFDVLNQTGTRVSTFDLMHNSLYRDTSGRYDLRQRLRQWREDNEHFGALCSDERPDFLCQVVTGCYLSEAVPEGAPQGRRVPGGLQTIKAGDLLLTPTDFYEKFEARIGAIESYAAVLFSQDVLGQKLRLGDIPYPASVILFLSLNWAREHGDALARAISATRTAQLFRAFYWSNVLCNRYDQGYLAQFARDRKDLLGILVAGQPLAAAEWVAFANDRLGKMQGINRKNEADLIPLMLAGDPRGAFAEGVEVMMRSLIRNDVVSGRVLDWSASAKDEAVELHHFFPQAWCRDNRARSSKLTEAIEVMNCLANKLPLCAKSNQSWKSKEPVTALAAFGTSVDDPATVARLDHALIDEDARAAIKVQNFDGFVAARAALLAKRMVALQFVQ